MTIQLPIAPHELSCLGPSLFLTLVEVHVRIALLRPAAKAGSAPIALDAMPFELQLGLVSTAVVKAARCMPDTLHERLVANV